MLKLQWLQINKFRAVKPGTRLVFNPSFNVLLGQNGTGKTTLLNLVAAVVSSDFTSLQDEEFELEYELAADRGSIRVDVRNVRSTESKMAFLGTLVSGTRIAEEFEAPSLSAEIKISSPNGSPMFIVLFDGGKITIRRGDGAANDVAEQKVHGGDRLWVVLALALGAWFRKNEHKQDSAEAIHLYAEAQGNAEIVRFDESLGYFEKLKDAKFLVVYRKTGKIEASSLVAPDQMSEELGRLSGLERKAERYALKAEGVPFLNEVKRLFSFESAEAVVELQESHLYENDEMLEFGNLRFLFMRSDGSRISGQHLSYGQKRMLAFMYYQATAYSVIIADELVNGLHHGWIRACIETLGERQVFLTSQNPLLLDYLTFNSPEQVRSTFVICRWEKEAGGGQMIWEDMSQESAEDFFASYNVGFQQVGELLQSKGLW